jgi:hypothetical protein
VGRLRLNGLVSLNAPYCRESEAAVLVTKPLKFTGQSLFLNLNSAGPGSVVVEVRRAVQQPDSEPLLTSVALSANGVELPVFWSGSATSGGNATAIGALAGEPVVLTVKMQAASLYSLRFKADDDDAAEAAAMEATVTSSKAAAAAPVEIERHGAFAPFWGETSPVLWNTSRLLRMATRYPQPCAPGQFSGQGGYAHLSVHAVASGDTVVDPIPLSEGTTYGSGYTAAGLGFHAFGSNWCMHNCGGSNPASGPHACRYRSGGTQIIGFRSVDPALQIWTGGTVALEISESGKAHGCSMYNTDVHRGSAEHGYVMAIETVCTNATDEWAGFGNGGFHNIFATHPGGGGGDLATGWQLLDPSHFLLPMRSEPYWLVNCPTIRFFAPYYYVAPASFDYDPATGNQTSSRLSTWLARSKDLHSWQKSPAPLVAPAAADKTLNYRPGSAAEADGLAAVNDTNASDLDWVELPNGTVYLEWSMGCQVRTKAPPFCCVSTVFFI